jgi:hypothetical protein
MTDGGGAWDALSPAEQAEVMEQQRKFQQALEKAGKYVASYRLAPAARARTVRRAAGGRTHVTDGPFAETKEVLGGLYVIEAASLEEAVAWAERGRFIPGANEVRRLID